jgi:hypothetical protein
MLSLASTRSTGRTPPPSWRLALDRSHGTRGCPIHFLTDSAEQLQITDALFAATDRNLHTNDTREVGLVTGGRSDYRMGGGQASAFGRTLGPYPFALVNVRDVIDCKTARFYLTEYFEWPQNPKICLTRCNNHFFTADLCKFSEQQATRI